MRAAVPDRILIVGVGSIGQRHVQLARAMLPSAEIRVLRHQAGKVSPEGVNGVCASIEDAIAFAPQIAVLSNPAPFHVAIAQALAEKGVHLLVEKPLAASLDGVARLLDTCQRHGVVLLNGYNLRYLPSLRRFRDLLHEGAVGGVLSVRCEVGQYLPAWRPHADYRHSVSANKDLGGGALLELSHELDYMRWIFGEVEWVQAVLCRQSSLELDVEDTAHLVLGFAPSSNGHQLVGTVQLDFVRQDTTRICVAIGETGSLRWNALTGEVDLFAAEALEWRREFCQPVARDDSYRAEWTDLIACVTEGRTPFVTGEDGLSVLHIIEATRASSASGRRTAVSPASVHT